MKFYYTYAMYDNKKDKFYIGYTANLKKRVSQHQSHSGHTSKRLRNLVLVYYEACVSEEDARKRERKLKTGFGRGYLRRRLISSINNLPL